MISSQIYWSMYELIIISVEKEKLLQKTGAVFLPLSTDVFKEAVEHTNLNHSAADSKYVVLQQRLSHLIVRILVRLACQVPCKAFSGRDE